MPLSITQCKAGQTILLEGQVFLVLETRHVKPGKGGAFIRTRLKNLKLGTVLERTFKGNDAIDTAYIEQRKLLYQYHTHDTYHFIDQETYEQTILTKKQLGDNLKFLKDNLEVTVYLYKQEPLNIVLPNFISFKIIETEPGIRGDTAKASLKPAKIETGAVVNVPLFISVGDKIKIDTREGKYIGRV